MINKTPVPKNILNLVCNECGRIVSSSIVPYDDLPGGVDTVGWCQTCQKAVRLGYYFLQHDAEPFSLPAGDWPDSTGN